MTGIRFEKWFEFKLIDKVQTGCSIIMDRASFHRKKQLEEVCGKAKVNLMVLHAYSTDFYPIDKDWANMKRDLRDSAPLCDLLQTNGSRVKLWKKQLQAFANITGLEVPVSHFPPGTSKWNKIEHRMFCYISKNWRGRPFISVEAVIELISNTTTMKGLRIVCVEDKNKYELGTKVTDEE
jgi:transposase